MSARIEAKKSPVVKTWLWGARGALKQAVRQPGRLKPRLQLFHSFVAELEVGNVGQVCGNGLSLLARC
jgi:hypothetical protein